MDLVINGMIRQMDMVTASLPDEIPEIQFEQLDLCLSGNYPGIFRSAARSLGLTHSGAEILENTRNTMVNVALTPLGNADSPLNGQFVQPCQVEMTVGELLTCLASDNENLVFYMQSQDDNLNKEFINCQLIPRDLELLKQESSLLSKRGPPEATNLWIGGEKTRSRLHNDHYDNIFVQVSGKKRIYLIPPAHVYGVHEQFLTPSRYELRQDGKLELLEDNELSCKVLFPTVDPRDPDTQDESYSYCKVYAVDLDEGDALFIPALWYHQVEITSSNVNLSVNYWYSPSPHSQLWPMWDYQRMSSLVSRGYFDKDYFMTD